MSILSLQMNILVEGTHKDLHTGVNKHTFAIEYIHIKCHLLSPYLSFETHNMYQITQSTVILRDLIV